MAFDPRLNFSNPNLFLDLLKIRKEKNMDSNIVVVGEKRTGKTWASIKLAETLKEKFYGEKFDVKKGLFFNPREFMEKFHSTENDVLILDEASESFDRRTWYEIQNKIFNSLLVREGYRQNIVIMTFPVLTDLDSRSIRLCSHLITMGGVNKEQNFSVAMVYRLKLIHIFGKTAPRIIQGFRFFKPSDSNLVEYEQMKRAWNKNKNEENINILEEFENPTTYQKHLKPEEYINLFRKEVINKEEFTEMMLKLNYGQQDIDFVIKSVDKKNNYVKQKIQESDGSLITIFNPNYNPNSFSGNSNDS